MNNFTRIKSTLEYINALHEEMGKTPISALADSELVIISKGGNESGTWFQEDLAIYFAQWLNPRFSVWCTHRIKEIINKGFSALTESATSYIEDQIGDDVELINLLIHQIQTGFKHPGRTMQKFMELVDVDPNKIASIMEAVHKNYTGLGIWNGCLTCCKESVST